ncbi:MAG: hypothetical protein ACK4ND_19730 [Cytophagaceae bacterium]
MKKFLLAMVFMVAGISAKAQFWATTEEIPQEVCRSLAEEHIGMNMEDVDWDRDGFHYKAEFSKENREYEVLMDAKGNILSTQREIAQSELPSEVLETLSNEFGAFDLNNSRMNENAESTLYKVDIETSEDSYTVILDEDGELVHRFDS